MLLAMQSVLLVPGRESLSLCVVVEAGTCCLRLSVSSFPSYPFLQKGMGSTGGLQSVSTAKFATYPANSGMPVPRGLTRGTACLLIMPRKSRSVSKCQM